jgi:uncharacterized protein YsxB (DUF464 family)
MIHVTVLTKNDTITMFKVTGHASSAPYGKDLVCAGVSAVVVGGLNALKIQYCRIKNQEGLSEVQIDQFDTHNQQVLAVILVQLQTLVEAYPEFVSIKIKE